MKVILVKDVSSLGKSGDVREVSDGYARNFLMPKHLVLPATSQLLAQMQKEEQERQDKIQKLREHFLNLKRNLESKTIAIKAKADKGKLFAAVREKDIAAATGLRPEQIIIKEPIKAQGSHEVEARLFEEIKAKIKLDIQAQ